jgi:hypothetical protein
MEKISWTDRLKNEKVLHRVKEEMNILRTKKMKGKANGIGHILRRNCLQEHVIQGKNGKRIEVTRRQGKIRKQLPGDIK